MRISKKMRKSFFKVGDRVKLKGCPFDEQQAEELLRYIEFKDKIQTVTATMIPRESGTSGQWIKTDMTAMMWPDNVEDLHWTDKAWFEKVVCEGSMRKKSKLQLFAERLCQAAACGKVKRKGRQYCAEHRWLEKTDFSVRGRSGPGKGQ